MSEHPPEHGADDDRDDTATTLIPGAAFLDWDAGGLTNTGRVRRVNEDAFLVHPRTTLWLVADGMGGHAKGDVASGNIVRAFTGLEVPEALSASVDRIEQTLIDLNTEFRTLADFGRAGVTIGSTVVVLLARQSFVLFLWVGDSRLYRSRGGQLEQLTQDHSQVEEMITEGLLRPEDAESHPAANVVTRAVGAADELYVDMDYRVAADGDRFLLCSDGVTKELPDTEIAAILAQEGDAATLARQLVTRALSKGARDNITAVVAVAHALQEGT